VELIYLTQSFQIKKISFKFIEQSRKVDETSIEIENICVEAPSKVITNNNRSKFHKNDFIENETLTNNNDTEKHFGKNHTFFN
jgi:CRISPR/Cas system CSM-associated protein Csm4 (group 5 of RAMP superfamily)